MDYRASLLRDHLARFTNFNDVPALEADARGRAAAVMDVIGFNYTAIAAFYAAPVPREAGDDPPAYVDPLSADIPASMESYLRAHPAIKEDQL